MSPRSASVNEELRRRSRERLLQAAVELVSERGYEATTLGDIADRAGSARGLVSYYFPGKRTLVQSAVHRLMHRTLEEALEREPRTPDGRERMRLARASFPTPRPLGSEGTTMAKSSRSLRSRAKRVTRIGRTKTICTRS